MNGEQFQTVIVAFHDTLREGGQIEATDDHGEDDLRRDDDACIALAGDLVMKLRKHGLTVSKLRSDTGRKRRG